MDANFLIYGFLWYIVFLFSSTLHEASHAFAAMRLGDNTAQKGGQVSLNPIPHMQREPFGTIIMPILSFAMNGGSWMIGWASAPYDPYWAYRHPKRAALMSISGPAANLAIVIVSGLFIHLGIQLGWFSHPDSANFTHIVSPNSTGIITGLATLLSIMFSLNLVLFVFNLIPLPPLDGSGILPFFLNADKSIRYMEFISQPTVSIVGLLIAWQLFAPLFDKIFTLALNLLYPGLNYA